MATMNFMKVAGADGDSQDAGHTGWLDIEPFTMSASNQGSFAIGSGGNTGGSQMHDLTINAVLDKAMPVIYNKISTGDVVSELKLEACKMVGKQQVAFKTITLKNVYLTGLSTGSGSSADGQPMVTYSMCYEEAKVEYQAVSNDGKKAAKTENAWNAKQNQQK
jgi:type VI secretion system secreted protein Hcp